MNPLRLVRYRIRQRPNSFDGDFHGVSRIQRTDTSRGSGGDEISGLKRHHLRDEAHDHIDGEEKVDGISILTQLSVHARLNANAFPRVQVRSNDRANRTERVKSLCPRPLAVFVLQVARGDIVNAGVTQDEIANVVRLAQKVAALSDDDP